MQVMTEKTAAGAINLFRLDGRVALITGGSKGLGEAMGAALAGAGAGVMLVSRHEDEVKAAAARMAEQTGSRVLGLAADITDKVQMQGMVDETMAAFGRIDILINNAGINIRKPSLEMSDDEWGQVLDLNLTAPFRCCKAVAPQMIERGYGRIINMSSTLGSVAIPGRAPYTSTKAGMIMLSKTLALEWAPHGVTVNAICPGPFRTPLNESISSNPEAYQAFLSNIPLGRWAEPYEIGGLALLLASEAGSFITGAALLIDGGWTAR
jgi:NAD(P)-dependent dehydrogenase (short-subunit alcohol dehydrogenase family)